MALLTLAAPCQINAQDTGIDLDMIMQPSSSDGNPVADENPLDQEFKVAMDAYLKGEFEKARQSWSELSDAGHGLSTHNLAVLVWRGHGGPRDQNLALSLFKQAGDTEIAPSLHALGVIHLKGALGKADPVEAVRYFEAASAIGYAPSTYNLALAHLTVTGPIELQASFPPSVAIQGVKIANAKWGSRKDMMTAKTVVAEIDLLPLLRGEMALPRLRMIGVDIVVERRANGKTNWDELNDFETAAGPAGPAGFPVIFPQIAGATISVAGGSLTIVDPLTVAPTTVSLGGVAIEVPAVDLAGSIPCT